MENFFTLHYWFNPQPDVFPPFVLYVYIILMVVFAAAIFLSGIYLKRNKDRVYFQTIKQTKNFFITNLIIGLFLLFFAYETIPYLSSRFLFLLWGLTILVHLFFILKGLKKIPELKKQFAAKQEYNKYIP